MAHKRSFTRPFAFLLLSSLLPVFAASQPTTQLAAGLDGDAPGGTVALPAQGTFVPTSAVDRGPASPSDRLGRMLLLLSPPADRQQALTLKLASLQNPSSTDYHRWLTPAAFANSYANSSADVATVVEWMRSEGFSVAPLPTGRGWIEFSGTVSQVELAFRTQVHSVTTGGATRAVITGSIRIPAALKTLVAGLVSLDGSLSTPAMTPPEALALSAAELEAQTSLSDAPALTPQLAARLLHFDSLHAAGTVGTGETIAVAARSNVRSEDIAAFRAAFGLPVNPLAVRVNGTDPGRTADEPAAALLASWAGAVAPGAQIVLVPAATTSATDGLDLSLAAIVDQALANVVAVSFSSCEAALSPAHQSFYAAVYRQAAAQGMSIAAAAGDSGAAACHAAGSDAAVTSGYAVNALAATPWNTAVGVAAFADRGALAFSAWSPLNPADPAFAGGGGSSVVHALPSWQPTPSSGIASDATVNVSSGATGLFSGHRLLPDIAIPTAIDGGLNPGVAYCLGGASASGGCTLVRSGGSGVAAAVMAGIAALLDQKAGAQGNLAPSLYRLANTTGVFADVAQGNATLRCDAGTAGCDANGQIGYTAAAGFDLATGLGVVNAQALADNWAKPQDTGTGVVTVELTPSALTINPSATLTLSALVTATSLTVNPTGTVLFFDRSTNVQFGAAVPLSGSGKNAATGSVTVTAALPVGTHNLAAQYSGDSTFAGDESPSVPVTVALSPTSVVVTPAATTVTAGASLAVQATITASNPGTAGPSGTLTFNIDGVSQGSPAVVQGSSASTSTSSITLSNLTVGPHILQGYYSGDPNYNNATSTGVSLTVNKGATTTTLVASSGSSTAGSPIALTATLAPTVPVTGSAAITGTVSFFDGSSLLGTATLNANVASLSAVTLSTASATHTITAAYVGDTNWTASTSNIVTVTTAKGGTVTTVVASSSTPTPGLALTFTATVAPSASIAGAAAITGSVSFYDGAAFLGTATVSSSSVATLGSITLPVIGAHSITAVYAGDTNWTTSTSKVLSLTVAKAATVTTLTANASSATPGFAFTFTATVAPSLSVTGAAAVTGSVTFYDGTNPLGTVPVSTSNVATLSGITLGAIATQSITAVYAGDTNWTTSTSNALSIVIAKGATVTTLTATPSTLTAGSASTPVTLSAAIAAISTSTSSVAISGTVSFYDGTKLLGTATITSNAASLSAVPLSNSVDHSITAIYSGDVNWLTSTSTAIVLQSPLLADTVTLTASPTNPTPGQSVILTATVSPLAVPAAAAEQNPSGTVTFYAGTTAIGTGTLTASASTTTLNSAVATLTISTLPGGTDQVSAVYSGDLVYKTETSNVLTLTVQNFTITPSATNPATNLNIVQGGSGSASFVVTGNGGFNGLVQVVCSVPTQDDMTCTASPQDVTPPATVTFVVHTFKTGTTPPGTSELRTPWLPGGPARRVARAVSETALALLGFLLLPFGRRARIFIRSELRSGVAQKARRFFILLLLLGGFAGMGLGCSTNSAAVSTGTPLGVATLTITASANVDNAVVSQSLDLTVNVVTATSTTP